MCTTDCRPARMEELGFEHIQFKPEWEYVNSATGFEYKSGVIPGKLIYSSLRGNVDAVDAEDAVKTLADMYEFGSMRGATPIRVADYSGVDRAPLAARKQYARLIQGLNEEYNCRPEATYICGANLFIRSAIRVFAAIVGQRFVFVDSVEQAFRIIQAEQAPATPTEARIEVSQSDLDEINAICSSLFWTEAQSEASPPDISPTNPLAELRDTLALVREDIAEFLEQDARRGQTLSELLEAIHAGLIIVDEVSHDVLYANAAAAAMALSTPDSMIGRRCHEFICPAQEHHCPITDKGLTVDKAERVLLGSDGSSCPVIKSVKRFEYQGRPCLLRIPAISNSDSG